MESFNAKIFRIDSGGPMMFRSRDPGPPIVWTTTEFYNLLAPQAAGDGSVIAFTGTRPCGGGSGCLSVQTAQGTVIDRAGNELLRADGYVNISPSGRYAVFSARNGFPSITPRAELVDLKANTHINVPYSFFPEARRRVADDGTVAFFDRGAILLWRTDGQQIIDNTSIAAPGPGRYPDPLLMISSDSKRLVYQTRSGLAAYDRTQEVETTVMSGLPLSLSISEDGRTIAWVDASDSQVWVSSSALRLTAIPEGVAEVALSGDARLAFATTNNGRLLRVEVASGAITEIIPRTPWIINSLYDYSAMGIYAGVGAGSLVGFTGVGLSDLRQSARSPAAGGLGDVRILLGGADVPVEAISPDRVWFQVPWELQEENYTLEFHSGHSPFETGPDCLSVKRTARIFSGHSIRLRATT